MTFIVFFIFFYYFYSILCSNCVSVSVFVCLSVCCRCTVLYGTQLVLYASVEKLFWQMKNDDASCLFQCASVLNDDGWFNNSLFDYLPSHTG